MVEYKKWFQEFCSVENCPEDVDDDIGCDVCESVHEAGWKAALKRILQEEFNYEREVDVFDWIRKELGT